MGDAALLLPVLKEVSFHLKGPVLDVLCEPRNNQVFQDIPYISRTHSYRNPADLGKLVRSRYDLIVDTEQSHMLSAILAAMIPAGVRIGFRVNGRQRFYDHTVQYRHDLYELEMFRQLFQLAVDLPDTFEWNPPYLGSEHAVCVEDEMPKDFICCFPGASIDQRLWPEQRWARVIDSLADYGYPSVLIGGKAEREMCLRIVNYCKKTLPLNLCDTLNIPETASLLQRAKILISTDSGILHVGVLCQLPSVSLFGPGISEKWGPRGARDRVLNKDFFCSPCTKFGHTPQCYRQKGCITAISPDDVVDAVLDIEKGAKV